MKTRKIVTLYIALFVLFASTLLVGVTHAEAIKTGDQPFVGVPTQKTWTFEASKSGTYKIEFEYSRPWEKSSSDQTVIYTVKVLNKSGSKSKNINLSANKINTVNKGQKFTVSLEENPSTGYSWNYHIEANVITPVDIK